MKYKACVINARQLGTARHSRRVSIQQYDLRLYGKELGPSPYIRYRLDGTNPKILSVTSSGHGPPQWMTRLVELINNLPDSATLQEIETLVRANRP